MIKHLYIHIPFCARRCAYCDFNTYANMDDRMEAYVDALCVELRNLRTWWQTDTAPLGVVPPTAAARLMQADLHPTVFLGGGTPSILPLRLMERVLAAANEVVPLAGAEVTIEANPGTLLDSSYLYGLRALGVNRLSMGVQTLHDPTLRVLGRSHTATEAYASFEAARAAGFENINLDFIFGLPGQTIEQWNQTLDAIGRWEPEHLSLYSLILEEKTPLFAQVQGGHVRVPDDDTTATMYEAAIERLGAAGFVQYEISNWARDITGGTKQRIEQITQTRVPTYACHHNLAYWLNADYLAAGAGAHGHIYPQRWHDILGIDAYIAAVAHGEPPVAEVIDLDGNGLAAETMFMGLRLSVGVSYAHFYERTGRNLDDTYDPMFTHLEKKGLLERDRIAVRLTPRGRMFGNQVFAQFV